MGGTCGRGGSWVLPCPPVKKKCPVFELAKLDKFDRTRPIRMPTATAEPAKPQRGGARARVARGAHRDTLPPPTQRRRRAKETAGRGRRPRRRKARHRPPSRACGGRCRPPLTPRHRPPKQPPATATAEVPSSPPRGRGTGAGVWQTASPAGSDSSSEAPTLRRGRGRGGRKRAAARGGAGGPASRPAASVAGDAQGGGPAQPAAVQPDAARRFESRPPLRASTTRCVRSLPSSSLVRFVTRPRVTSRTPSPLLLPECGPWCLLQVSHVFMLPTHAVTCTLSALLGSVISYSCRIQSAACCFPVSAVKCCFILSSHVTFIFMLCLVVPRL